MRRGWTLVPQVAAGLAMAMGCGRMGFSTEVADATASIDTDDRVLPPPDFVARFSFNEATSTGTSSEGPTPVTGILNSGAVWDTGVEGSSVRFDTSSTSIVDVSTSSVFQLTRDMTVAGWYFLSSLPPVGTCSTLCIHAFENSMPSGNALYGLSLQRPGVFWYHEYGNQVGEPAMLDLPATSFDVGSWHHLAAVRSSLPSLTVTFYADGVMVGEVPYTGPAQFGELGALHIGRDIGLLCPAFPGMIDLLYIYDRALSSAEVDAVYQSGLAL